ncbi:MAG: cytidylate kinase-like family protein [Chloroflexi bacterium]|nr:cytidylate kinase-like family protein [Chloroflexota bacterium]
MGVITINGQIGSGGREIGALVAQKLGYDYVDVRILSEVAERLGATLEAVTRKEQRLPTRGGRLARLVSSFLERSALAGSAQDAYYGAGLSILLAQDYPQAAAEPITREDQIEDERYIATIKGVITGLADAGDVVIISRASNFILKDRLSTLHVGLVSTLASRVQVVMHREQVSVQEAETIAREHERARVAFFRRYFQAGVDNPNDYHLMLNTHRLSQEWATNIIVDAFTGVQ